VDAAVAGQGIGNGGGGVAGNQASDVVGAAGSGGGIILRIPSTFNQISGDAEYADGIYNWVFVNSGTTFTIR
jgi:hypothetical protein